MKIKLAVVDDYELIRAGLVQCLNLAPEIEVVAEASSGAELLDSLRVTRPDLVLLDMVMPNMSGSNLIAHVKSLYPKLPILAISMHNDANTVIRAMKAGASGYLCKDCSPQIMVSAIRKVMETGKYLSPLMSEQLAYAVTSSDPANGSNALSDREFEIYRLIVEGKSVSDIARQLFISDKTVSTHKSHILSKLGLRNVAELVRYALQRELFP
ncbi:MAG: response regulator transcription factor [Nitrosomonadales bacterium]|nr:response regulator transcription factor [Nitrosomonadales bacterium]